jgi:hypothetical protein
MTAFTSSQRRIRELGVVKGGLRPALGVVALVTAHAEDSMKVVRGRRVASGTVPTRCGAQQSMRKPTFGKSAMVVVTGAAILLAEILVERGLDRSLCVALNRGTFRVNNSNVPQRMTLDAPIRGCAAKRSMAGKAIVRDLGMGRKERARAHHRPGKDKGKHNQNEQID